MKKPPQKVTYLSRNSVVSEIFLLLPNSPNGSIYVPNVAYRATVYRTGPRKGLKNCYLSIFVCQSSYPAFLSKM